MTLRNAWSNIKFAWSIARAGATWREDMLLGVVLLSLSLLVAVGVVWFVK